MTKKRYVRSMGKVLAEYEDDGFYRNYSFIYAGDQRIAAPMVGGMLTSALLTLVVVQILYYQVHRKNLKRKSES